MSGRTFRTRGGRAVTLDQLIGQGGEGEVRLVDRSGEVAKIYWPQKRSRQRRRKIELMASRPPRDPMKAQGFVSLAWPTDALFDGGGAFAGFLMPRLDTRRCRPLHQVYRSSSYPAGIDWAMLVRTARNLASVVAAVHGEGYVIGDLNESNVLVATNTVVTLVDCDSMQVPDPSRRTVYRCAVGKAEYTPPELHGVDFSRVDRLPSADGFALAALICQLLVRGRHPFAGHPGPTIPDNIRAGETFFVNGFDAAPGAMPPRDFLPPDVERLFRRAFVEGVRDPGLRPQASEWKQTLDNVLGGLRTCGRIASHRYSGHLAACPWCVFEATLGRPAFPARRGRSRGGSRAVAPAAPRGARSPVVAAPAATWTWVGPVPGGTGPSLPSLFRRGVRNVTAGCILTGLIATLLIVALPLLLSDRAGSAGGGSATTAPVVHPFRPPPPPAPTIIELFREVRQGRSDPDAWARLAAGLESREERGPASAARTLADLLGTEIPSAGAWQERDEVIALLKRAGVADDEWIGDAAQRASSEGRSESAQALYYVAHSLDPQDREWLGEIDPRRGLRVRRGIDWESAGYGEQDGGPGAVGTITAVPPESRPGWVVVQWPGNTGKNWYRWGGGTFDLELAPEPAPSS